MINKISVFQVILAKRSHLFAMGFVFVSFFGSSAQNSSPKRKLKKMLTPKSSIRLYAMTSVTG